MSVSILCVGKLKESYFADAVKEYQKRLSRLMPVSIIELPDEREPQNASPALCDAVMKKEGERILQKIPQNAYVIAMCIEGKGLTSEKLAQKLQNLFVEGKSDIIFVIGGSLGLDEAVTRRAQEHMSMSAMTFPHQLARVMLMEQLYRAAKLNAGERYHK
ncbi:MAG: 23S rRNA (pseudouridine(1915)-N(3))-methyltransferase RlmH [Desulfovibrionaceae bacterium]|nr:23S rRNA (pseudouridine(1915)-N(3))-methyltransferase RlmH [Desulfovibrionaceae bacterium]